MGIIIVNKISKAIPLKTPIVPIWRPNSHPPKRPIYALMRRQEG
jgi:hypothetical protein